MLLAGRLHPNVNLPHKHFLCMQALHPGHFIFCICCSQMGCTPLDLAPPAELSVTQLLQNAPNPATSQHQNPSSAHSTPPRTSQTSSSSIPAAASLATGLLSPTASAGATTIGASRLGLSASSGGSVRSSLSARKSTVGGQVEHSSSSGGTVHREAPTPAPERERTSHSSSGAPVVHTVGFRNVCQCE